MKRKKKCEICGSKEYVFFRKRYNQFMCERHVAQLKLYGTVRTRTKFCKNKIELDYDFGYASIELYNKNNEIIAEAFVDIGDVDKIKDYKWRLNNITGYVVTNKDSTTLLLHRLILGEPKGKYIDHKDKNKLNCCKENLFIVSSSKNLENSKLRTNNTSGHKGVSFYKNTGTWVAQLQKQGILYRYFFKTKKIAIAYRMYLEEVHFDYLTA